MCLRRTLCVGELRFRAIHYGASIKLNNEMRTKLTTGPDKEHNQCAFVTISPGVEWILKGRPNRRPNSSRVLIWDPQIRTAELDAVGDTNAHRAHPTIVSASRDIISHGHGRDIRVSHWLLLPVIRSEVSYDIRVVEITTRRSLAAVRVSAHPKPGRSRYMLAFPGHLRWLMTSEFTNPGERKKWAGNFDKSGYQPNDGWEACAVRMGEYETRGDAPLFNRRYCEKRRNGEIGRMERGYFYSWSFGSFWRWALSSSSSYYFT